MTLAEMLDEIVWVLGSENEFHADIVKRLNRVMEYESRDLLIPQRYSEVEDVTGSFSLPSGAREEGLLEVRRHKDGTKFNIYTSQEADLQHPGWSEWDPGSTSFIVFDPKTEGGSGTVILVPSPKSGDTEDFTITYAVVPDEMTDMDDEPWNGHLPSFHEMLVQRVAFELLLRAGDDRWQAHYQNYQRLRGDAFDASRPRVLFGNNWIYREVMNAGTS